MVIKMETEQFVKVLVESGMSEELAQKKIDNVITKMTDTGNIDDVTEEQFMKMVKIISKRPMQKDEILIGVCIGFDSAQDNNDKIVNEVNDKAWHTYEDTGTYDSMVDAGLIEYVRDDDGEIVTEFDMPKYVIIDTREFIDKNQTMVNNNIGKPLKADPYRYAYFIVDNTLVTVRGNINPEIGVEYTIYTNKIGGNVIYTNRNGISFRQRLSEYEMWEFINDAAAEMDCAHDLSDIDDLSKYTLMLTSGTVSAVPRTKKGFPFILMIDDECFEATSVFSQFNPEMVPIVEELKPGNDIVVLGKVNEANGNFKASLQILGIVKDPESDTDADILGEFEESFNE